MTESENQPVHWLIVFAVVLTAVLEVLDTTIVNVALPHIKAAFGITSDQTVWIVTSYIVASIAVMPLTGLLSRKLGFAFFSALGAWRKPSKCWCFFV